MSSINPQIEAAVELMKARAAMFDDSKTMNGLNALQLSVYARQNLHSAWQYLFNASAPNDEFPLDRKQVLTDLVDTMNLCALAISVLPEEK